MIDLDWIERLLRLVDDSDVDTLEVSRFGTRVRISKSPPSPPAGAAPPGAPPRPAASPSPSPGGGAPGPPGPSAAPSEAEAGQAGEPSAAEEAPAETEPEYHEVSSPMVGTFYRAPAPDAPAYVEVGDRVEEGQTLCILEAMKLMNELDSEISGVVEEICAENAEPVEYGDVLFRIDTEA